MTFFTEEYIRAQCTKEPWCMQKGGHIQFGRVHKEFLETAKRMPDGMPAKQEFLDAAELAKKIYGEQAWNALKPLTLDDDKIREWCKAEPWTTATRVEDLSSGTYGYVVDKLVYARNYFPKDSQEYILLNDFVEKAFAIYDKDISDMAQRYASGRARAEVEATNLHLFKRHHDYEGNGTFPSNRMLELAEYTAHFQQMNTTPVVRPDSMQQMVLRDKNEPTPP